MPDRYHAMTEIQTVADHAQCSRVRKVVSRLAMSALYNPGSVADIELAVGEAFTNAVKYGVQDSKLTVRVEESIGQLAVELDYPGQSFDTAVKYPRDIWNTIGGFGRFIMQQITDSMDYQFKDGHTILRMTKRG